MKMLKLIFSRSMPTIPKYNVRLFGIINLYHNKNDNIQTVLKDFTPVYRFPYITAAGIINRLKLYQTTLTALAIPASITLWQFDMIAPELALTISIVGASGCTFFYSMGYFTNKLIGAIYLNSEKEIVRVAYVDFWGQRQDIEMNLKDIIPLSDQSSHFTDKLYKKFSRFSVQETLKINLENGQILDKEKFNIILGVQ